jgi:hypothetical protein
VLIAIPDTADTVQSSAVLLDTLLGAGSGRLIAKGIDWAAHGREPVGDAQSRHNHEVGTNNHEAREYALIICPMPCPS